MPRALPALFLAVLWLTSPAQAQPRIDPVTAYGVFHVHPTTGALAATEDRLSKVQSKGSTYYCFLEGVTSTSAFGTAGPHRFVKRELMSRDDIRKGKLPTIKLEELAVKDGRRYGTKAYITLDITRVGEPEFGKDPEPKKDRGYVTFMLTPRTTLTPGEYAFSMFGIVTPIAGFSPFETTAYAFRIDAAAAAPAPAPPTTATSAASGTASPLFGSLAPTDAAGQFALAVRYRDGTGVAADPVRAAALFRQAADQGHGAAQANLGYMYATGTGVPQDYVLAHQWLNLGTSRLSGDLQQQAATMRDQVAARMTPQQLADAQKAARDWLATFDQRNGGSEFLGKR